MIGGFQRTPAFQIGYQQLAPALADRGVVLFPPEALRFRSRWDKTMYGWSCLVRDMRAPVAGFRPMTDHYVSAVALAAA
jgi:hypothetical protein